MKIVIAPDSFKDSLSAKQVANAIAEGLQDVMPNVECCCIPVADGGEGTMVALIDATGGRYFDVEVMDPLQRKISAQFGVLGDGETAVIEMANASGIELLEAGQRNPMVTTSYGTGQLILAALEMGVKKIIVAIGGSATNDGGIGMMTALGARFNDSDGHQVAYGGNGLHNIVSIESDQLDARLNDVEFICACDVDNPLTGEKGASAVFGPQKGASSEMVEQLDLGLKNYAQRIHHQLGKDVEFVPGSGAAGGLGAALLAFLNAELKPGIDIVLQAVELEKHLENADIVITGEGRIDGQTIHGKTPVGVSRLAQSKGIPTVALAGALGEGCRSLRSAGIAGCFSVLSKPCTLTEALENAEENVRLSAQNLAGIVTALYRNN